MNRFDTHNNYRAVAFVHLSCMTLFDIANNNPTIEPVARRAFCYENEKLILSLPDAVNNAQIKMTNFQTVVFKQRRLIRRLRKKKFFLPTATLNR